MRGRGAAPGNGYMKTQQVPQLGCLTCREDLILLPVPVVLGGGELGADEHFPAWSLEGGVRHLLFLNKTESLPFHSPSKLQGPSVGSLMFSMVPSTVPRVCWGWDGKEMGCPSISQAPSLLHLAPRFTLFGTGQSHPPGRHLLLLMMHLEHKECCVPKDEPVASTPPAPVSGLGSPQGTVMW